MSLIKGLMQLQKAYIARDWNLVRSSYELISGESLEEPESVVIESPPVVEEKTIKKKIRNKKESGKNQLNTVSNTSTSNIKLVPGQIDTSLGSGPVKFRGNLFNPADYEVQDEAPWLHDNVKKSGKRDEFKHVEVTCSKCTKSYLVHPSLANNVVGEKNGEFKCQDCTKKTVK